MIVRTEDEMIELGKQVASNLTLPAVLELVGDVGAGKTTFTRGLAVGLGVQDPITSPSFTISKRYSFPIKVAPTPSANTSKEPTFGQLVHYDFYRLEDPGIMRDELSETLTDSNSVVIVEWGESIADLLPSHKVRLKIKLQPDGSRLVDFEPDQNFLNQFPQNSPTES